MLNIKYIVIGPQRDNVLPNPEAYGNAWFVREIVRTGTAADELMTTCSTDTRAIAVIDTTKFKVADITADTTATIRLVSSNPKSLKYESKSSSDGLAVFSEIYYPGWEATIDGNPANVLRADYILRALEIPAGEHVIEFVFRPEAYVTGNKITTASSWIVLLFLLGSIWWTIRDHPRDEHSVPAK
jgi:hypothetical protein